MTIHDTRYDELFDVWKADGACALSQDDIDFMIGYAHGAVASLRGSHRDAVSGVSLHGVTASGDINISGVSAQV